MNDYDSAETPEQSAGRDAFANHVVEACPFVYELTDLVDGSRDSLVGCFQRLQHLDGRLWFDSVTNPKNELGRYSFLTADPLLRLTARVGDQSPWPALAKLETLLPRQNRSELPPFQGGIAGLAGYEAATWLEDIPVPNQDDSPTDTISMGLYDWTIACDHAQSRTWLISQGFVVNDQLCDLLGSDTLQLETSSPKMITNCSKQAIIRGNQILQLLKGEVPRRPPFVNDQVTRGDLEDGTLVASNFKDTHFRDAVADVVQRIRSGDSFQVNLAQRISSPALSHADDLYLRLRRCNPAPFACFYDGGEFEVASSSPEGFLQVRDRIVETRPIKGTVPRVDDEPRNESYARELLASEKDRAENVMIVDLMRNDLSRVCQDDTVEVTQLCELEQYQYVQHLVSVVRGRLNESASITELLRVCFPGGSVTGAPKIEAMRTIAQLEPHRRGPYCGSMGYISVTGDADFNILIRTITATDQAWHLPAGGGITALSDPDREEQETWDKAAGMMKALPPADSTRSR